MNMTDQATALRGLMERRQGPAAEVPAVVAAARARTLAVTSGKGGVGKSNVALNLAIALAQSGASVCLFDANLGLGNIDLLCGLNGYWNLSHVITGARLLREVTLDGPAGVTIVPGASGLTDVADCPAPAQDDVLAQLQQLEQTHDYILFDTGSGIHRAVRQFAAAADHVLIVTTPEPTAITDAYATAKALAASAVPRMDVLLNQAGAPREADAILDRLQQTARLFLHRDLGTAGSIPHDPQVAAAVLRRTPLLIGSPHSPAARAITQLARQLTTPGEAEPARGSFFARLWQRALRRA